MKNYFASTKENPYHLSVGAVVLNEKGEVLCHHFSSVKVDGKNIRDLYLLVRETPNPNESLEDAICRGLLEEAGVTAKIKSYIGSFVSAFPEGDSMIEKTTIYFLCNLESIDESKRDKNDPESGSEIKFLPIGKLIKKMKIQGKKYDRTDVDESEILKRIK